MVSFSLTFSLLILSFFLTQIQNATTTYASQCASENTLDTHAFFLFPWETNNAFHSLNDNLFSVLSSIVLHYLTATVEDIVQAPNYKTLFLFTRIAIPKDQTLVFKLLNVLFENDVQPAGKFI